MSLRKPPELTPELLAAKRSNARRSTGPRTSAGKQNSKLNALKHGLYAAPENERQAMRALGEDPEEFENSKQELLTAFGPGDALWERQIDDLVKLYWRRDRLQRAQEGVMQRALQAIEDWQHRRRQEMAGVTFDPSEFQAIEIEMTWPDDLGVRLRLLLSFLGVIREQVKQRIFRPRQDYLLEVLYRGQKGWRQARLCFLLYLFIEEVKRRAHPEHRYVYENEFGRREEAGEAQYQELLRLLEEEIASAQEEFEYAEKANEEKVAIERDACLAPAGEQWKMMLRREETLDRSIDRKVRILLALRKEPQGSKPTASPADQGDDAEMANLDTSMENLETNVGIGIPAGGVSVERCSGEFVCQPREGPTGDAAGGVGAGEPGGAYMQTHACATPAIAAAVYDRRSALTERRYSRATRQTQEPQSLGSRSALPTARKNAGTKLKCL